MNPNLQRIFLTLAVVITYATSWCQSQKITEADYKKWHTLSGVNSSPDGLWSSFKLDYDDTGDTLFLQEIKTGKRIVFPKATRAVFSPNGKQAIIKYQGDSLSLQCLNTNRTIKLKGVAKYAFESSRNHFGILQNYADGKLLSIYDKSSNLLATIPNVIDFEWSNNGKIAVIESGRVSIYNPANGFRKAQVVSDTASSFKKLSWSKSAKILTFLKDQASPFSNELLITLFHYDVASGKLLVLDDNRLSGNRLTDNIQTPVKVSDDSKYLFFYYTTPQTKIASDDLVEIWDSRTKLVYPAQRIHGDPALKPKLAVWDLEADAIRLLATDDLPNSLMTWDYKYALTYSDIATEPQYEMIAPVDIYITNIQNGKRKLLLANQSASLFATDCSPSGQYINYFKEKNWWLYDTFNDKHINLTGNLNVSFYKTDADEPGRAESFTFPGWTSDGKFLILYDKFDIWLISPDLKLQRKITSGAAQQIRFRIVEYIYRKSDVVNSSEFASVTYNLHDGLILSASAYDHSTGYYKWNPDGAVMKIVFGKYKYSKLRKSAVGNEVIFVKENYQTPPVIEFWSKQKSSVKQIMCSNPHNTKYSLGSSRIITYKNKAGKELQSALFYPAGYEQGKSYPMIVYIYSRVSQAVYEYSNPTMNNPTGFSPSIYTSDGYVVLFPDIRYDVGNPGTSILDCVTSAVDNVIGMGVADKNNIGLIGHSYGGYETSYLLTRTEMFAAAVSGAAVTDMISSYLSVNTETGVKMDWRYESQQYRMGSTPFSNLKEYLENSTVINASKIATPLLSWVGKNDMQVDWKQSVELHLALRRLQKQNIFLAYQGEGHILATAAAQCDLTSRIKNWFDHYLKDKNL